MTDTAYHSTSNTEDLQPCEKEVFTFARQIGVV